MNTKKKSTVKVNSLVIISSTIIDILLACHGKLFGPKGFGFGIGGGTLQMT